MVSYNQPKGCSSGSKYVQFILFFLQTNPTKNVDLLFKHWLYNNNNNNNIHHECRITANIWGKTFTNYANNVWGRFLSTKIFELLNAHLDDTYISECCQLLLHSFLLPLPHKSNFLPTDIFVKYSYYISATSVCICVVIVTVVVDKISPPMYFLVIIHMFHHRLSSTQPYRIRVLILFIASVR